MIGALNYLDSISRPNVLFSVNQDARSCSNPKRSHEESVKRVGRHLKRTKDKGINYQFYATKPIASFVDVYFSRKWNLIESDLLAEDLLCSMNFIKIDNFPVHWVSKIQSEVALSITESKYFLLSQGTRDLIKIK